MEANPLITSAASGERGYLWLCGLGGPNRARSLSCLPSLATPWLPPALCGDGGGSKCLRSAHIHTLSSPTRLTFSSNEPSRANFWLVIGVRTAWFVIWHTAPELQQSSLNALNARGWTCKIYALLHKLYLLKRRKNLSECWILNFHVKPFSCLLISIRDAIRFIVDRFCST